MTIAFGIDIGGSGIKGAPVDVDAGEFTAERHRIPTPDPSTPEAVARVCRQVVEHFDIDADVPVGITIPAPIKHGTVRYIANLDQAWAGVDVTQLMSDELRRPVSVVNDADAAGYAEAAFGAARGVDGLVIVTTLGTGIGSAFVFDGNLIPNTELGHIEIRGDDAEHRASAAVREEKEWSFKKWAKRLQEFYAHVDNIFSPELIVVGGGVSKHHEKFLPLIDVGCAIVPAHLLNQAGIVGAARLAHEGYQG